ncbi:MAG: NTP transferase domain-containing protein [Methanomassiliicoccaceae archaeon]|nr:NTP transferase domain-containing protein [Methanomassiliicoccaceae archaeon]
MPPARSVVLSCAGTGSRLGLAQTKVLIEIDGKSLMAWQLELLKDVEDLRIVVGYQADAVVKEVLNYRKDVTFVYNHNYFNTKTGTSFYLGAKDGNDYAIGWDGDLIVHPDDIDKCLNSKGEYIVYSDRMSDEAVFVRTDENGDVLSFSREDGDYEWTGPVCIKKDKLKYTSGNVFNMLEGHLPMKGVKVRAQDIDTYDDYQKAVEFIRSWKK